MPEKGSDPEKGKKRKRKEAMMAEALGLAHLPIGIPKSRWDDLRLLLEAKRDGKMNESKRFDHLVVLLRFGILVRPDGKMDLHFWSLRDINKMTCKCTLTVRRWEKEVLEELRK
jgi:hypothetical protein